MRAPGVPLEEVTMDNSERQAELSKTEARQGVQLNAMRYVLIFGILGVIIAFIIAWFLVR
jgi:hypothetical protein